MDYIESMQFNVVFEEQFSISSRTGDNHGNMAELA
jgi:hypothetical protein